MELFFIEFRRYSKSCESFKTVESLLTISFKNWSTNEQRDSVGCLIQLIINLVLNFALCSFGSNLGVPSLLSNK